MRRQGRAVLGLAVAVLLSSASSQPAAAQWEVGTRLGYLEASSQLNSGMFRSSSLSFAGLPGGIRIVHRVYDGLGLTGAGKNWRVGLHAWTDGSLLGFETWQPYVGGNLTGTAADGTALAMEAGAALTIPLAFGLALRGAGEATLYSDRPMVEVQGGLDMDLFGAVRLGIMPVVGLWMNSAFVGGLGVEIRIRL